MHDTVVIVHSVDNIITALKTAEKLGITISMQTAESVVQYFGVSYIKDMLHSAQEHFDSIPDYEFICDAGDNPASVQELLHSGFNLVRFKGDQKIKEKLLSIVDHFGAALLEEAENVLDLCLSKNPEEDCFKWCKEFYIDEKATITQ